MVGPYVGCGIPGSEDDSEVCLEEEVDDIVGRIATEVEDNKVGVNPFDGPEQSQLTGEFSIVRLETCRERGESIDQAEGMEGFSRRRYFS